jgi:hypothetical protein
MQQYENQVDAWLEHRAKILAEHARIKSVRGVCAVRTVVWGDETSCFMSG